MASVNTGGDEVMLRQIRFQCGEVSTSAGFSAYNICTFSSDLRRKFRTYLLCQSGDVCKPTTLTERNQKARQDSQHLG